MDNMVTDVYAKSNCDRFHIDKALGNFANRKSDNNNNNNKRKKRRRRRKRRNVRAIGDPFPGPKIESCEVV